MSVDLILLNPTRGALLRCSVCACTVYVCLSEFAVRLLAIFNVSLCDGHSRTENVVCMGILVKYSPIDHLFSHALGDWGIFHNIAVVCGLSRVKNTLSTDSVLYFTGSGCKL